jgi:hypothetical protein
MPLYRCPSYHEGQMGMGCISLLLMAALLGQAQPDSLQTKPAGDVSIPAELTKTVRADKAHRGDPVEFTTLEAVLVGPKLVMPPQSKLFGRIVGAAPRLGDKPSWLVLLVERAEWKQHTVPLHAFISSQITLAPAPDRNGSAGGATDNAGDLRRMGRVSARAAAQSDTDLTSVTKPPQDATVQSQGETPLKAAPLKDVRIVRDQDGTSYLFSAKSNVKLPGGTMFMLQNHPPTATDQSATAGPH